MIHLKQTRGDRISVAYETRKRGYTPEAMYDYDTDRIVIVKAGENITGIINHEFMHKILASSSAAEKWDNEFITKTERWLGWTGIDFGLYLSGIWRQLRFLCLECNKLQK